MYRCTDGTKQRAQYLSLRYNTVSKGQIWKKQQKLTVCLVQPVFPIYSTSSTGPTYLFYKLVSLVYSVTGRLWRTLDVPGPSN